MVILIKQHENGLYSNGDHYTGLSPLSVEFQIEDFIGEEEACHTEHSQKVSQISMKLLCCILTMVIMIIE